MRQKTKKQLKIVKNLKIIAGFVLAIVFLLGLNIDINPNGNVSRVIVSAEDDELTEEEKKKKEDEIEDVEDEIDDLEDDIKKIEKSKQKDVQVANVIKGGINELSRNITNIKGQIDRTENELGKLNEDIKNKEDDIVTGKKRMAAIIRKMNRQRLDLKMTVLDSDKGIEEYIESRDSMEELQRSILNRLNELKQKRRELEKSKEEKAEAKNELDSQRSGLEQEKIKKSWLLGEKNKDINKHDSKIDGIQRKIDNLNATLSSFLGGSFDTDDIVDAIKFASKRTGVRKEFLMAMLDKETDLGRFTGGCTYKNTRMRTADKEEFKKICKSLGYNYKKKKISCSLSYGYGGAMGVAQFMPTTWIGYKSAISRYTGHNPPDPWNLTDGVMGMAEKLKRAGASSKSKEHYAAKVYYCGGPSSDYWNTHCEAYADTVKNWANGGYDKYF